MSSSFILTLDTTSPSVEVYIPTYTIVGLATEINIVASEPLSNYQEFQVESPEGSIYDLTFLKETPSTFTGTNIFPSPGVWTFRYQVEDEVGNKCNFSSISIQVLENVAMYIITSYKVRKITNTAHSPILITNIKKREILTNTKQREITINAKEREVLSKVIKKTS